MAARLRAIVDDVRRVTASAAIRPLFAIVLTAAAASTVPEGSAGVPAAAERAIADISARELRSHVEVLASDEFGGRRVGQPGNRRAEEYAADALQRAGISPPADTHFQNVELYAPSLGPDARLTIAPRSGPPLLDLAAGSSFFPLPVTGTHAATGPVVFAGHGISEPKLRHDDYAGLSARGAVVVVLEGAPEALTSRTGRADAEALDLGSLDRKMADATRHGAVGLLLVRRYLGDIRDTWPAHASPRASYRLREPSGAARLAVGVLSEPAAVMVREALEARTALVATLVPDVAANAITVHNVLGTLNGGGASRRETVVVGAHLDHDGVDEEGRVYNGADDNASGTAAVLAMASAFARAAATGTRPGRTIVFALWNAEEQGSLGAQSYLAAPLTAGRIVANINLDMVGRHEEVPDPDDPRFRGFRRTRASESRNVLHLLGYSYSPDLARAAERANEGIGLTLKTEYDRDAQGLLQRSDNWPFLTRRIPALFFTTGLHPDYHTPDDDVARIDFAKLERVAELVSRVVWIVADGDPPRFKLQ